MKQLGKFFIALCMGVLAMSGVQAQQGKVAHIDVQQLLADMPEMKAAQAELKKLQDVYRADIESSMTELKNKFDQYQQEASNKTADENKRRADELAGYERNIQQAEQTAMQEMQKKQQELFKPISEKAKKAIEKVAAEQGFDYVIDASPGLGLIVANGKDLLPDVKRELGF